MGLYSPLQIAVGNTLVNSSLEVSKKVQKNGKAHRDNPSQQPVLASCIPKPRCSE